MATPIHVYFIWFMVNKINLIKNITNTNSKTRKNVDRFFLIFLTYELINDASIFTKHRYLNNAKKYASLT